MTNTPIKDENRCRHTFHRVWCPCPFGCHETEYAIVRGLPTTPEELEHVAVVSEAARGQTLQSGEKNKRRLQLQGTELAGCQVGEMAADATQSTRFHTRMSCGHMAIVSGTDLKMAHKKGLKLRCKPCQVAYMRQKRAEKRAVK